MAYDGPQHEAEAPQPGVSSVAQCAVRIQTVAYGVVRLQIGFPGDPVGVPTGIYPELDRRSAALAGRGSGRGPTLGVAWEGTPQGSLRLLGPQGILLEGAAPTCSAGPGWAEAAFVLPQDAVVLGLGAKMGRLNRRGRRWRFWNVDRFTHLPDTDPLYASLPQALVISQGKAMGLALLWGGESAWDVGHEDPQRLKLRTEGGGLDLLVAAGPRPGDCLRRLARLLGRSALVPLWALGYHQSRWGYGDAESFLAVARTFRERGLPLDALYMDLDYMHHRRPLVWDPQGFPDPRGFAAALHALGVRLVAIANGGIPVTDPRYAEWRRRGLCVSDAKGTPIVGRLWGGPTVWTDFFHPQVARVWRRELAGMAEAGVDGIWNDMNEPSFLEGGHPDPERYGHTLPGTAVHHGEGAQEYPHLQVHNLYALVMDRVTYRAWAELREGRRPFLLSRSGSLGVGRYAALWTGDNASWWEHLRASLPMVASFGVSGVPLAGVDIGGFQGEPTPELLARWYQAGALMPFCRNHASVDAPPQEPYAWGETVEGIARAALTLRYRLLPTLYSLMFEARLTGEPVWRPLAYGFPTDPRALSCEDEVLIGAHLLHAPVLEPGVDARRVYLPQGLWYRIDPNWPEVLEGGRSHLAMAPLEASPLYARGGAILAVDPDPADRARPPQAVDLWLFPGGRGRLYLFEDDGESFAYLRGDCRVTRLDWECDRGGRGRLRITPHGKGSGARLRLRFPEVACPGAAPSVHLLGHPQWTPDQDLPPGRLELRVQA